MWRARLLGLIAFDWIRFSVVIRWSTVMVRVTATRVIANDSPASRRLACDITARTIFASCNVQPSKRVPKYQQGT
ncbi:hypothetical protein LF1_09740 [Rubripirellula obstinata]|uniref:Uncharacterized protein n=1 Tax=Rubripirellula obstinata TaxID=406547 RepID=A0A5B1CGX1_9BACT|nr:hypothetical protein LF1_09740 [Rubripirellula obstinata]